MRKTVAAAVLGLLMVAGQAAAASNNASARLGDRAGARVDASEGFAGVPLPVLLVGAAVVVAAVVTATDDDSQSD